MFSIYQIFGGIMIEWEINRLIDEKESELLEAIKKKQWIKAQRIADELRELKKIKRKIEITPEPEVLRIRFKNTGLMVK